MWKTFQYETNSYMIKIVEIDNLRLVLTDFQNIWVQDIAKHELLHQFQEANPLFDIKVDEVVCEVIETINKISGPINIEILETDEGLHLLLDSIKSGDITQFKFNLRKSTSETFFKEITMPLIQTVKHLEERQNMLINLLQKKDKELEQYKLEKGPISRSDLITEKFDEEKLSSIDDKSMMNVFGQNETFWENFVSQDDNIAHVEDDSEMEQCSPPEKTTTAVENFLPEKSKSRYEKSYRAYKDWCCTQRIHNVNLESVLLAYFIDLAKDKTPSTLWATYSMLRSTMGIRENTDISKFSRVKAFLKKQSVGYKPKKSSTFTKNDIDRFLKDAPMEFLPQKVALILGVSGACRADQLFKMSTDYLHFLDKDKVIVSIPDAPTFFISNPEWVTILKHYCIDLRQNIDNNRLFMQIRHNKMTTESFDHNTVSMFPKKIATFLKLKNPENFTGHCYRRTASLLGDVLQLKMLRGAKSPTVDENEENSVETHKEVVFVSTASSDGDPLGDPLECKVDIKEEVFP